MCLLPHLILPQNTVIPFPWAHEGSFKVLFPAWHHLKKSTPLSSVPESWIYDARCISQSNSSHLTTSGTRLSISTHSFCFLQQFTQASTLQWARVQVCSSSRVICRMRPEGAPEEKRLHYTTGSTIIGSTVNSLKSQTLQEQLEMVYMQSSFIKPYNWKCCTI